MQHSSKASPERRPAQGLLGPGADRAFAPLADASIRRRVVVAHLVERTRRTAQDLIGRPVGRAFMKLWMRGGILSHSVESFGLSRHVVEEILGADALTLHVDPRKLIRIGVHASRNKEKRPSPLAFIWEGSWDQRREDLRVGTRYALIRDLDENRHQLENTARYRYLMARLEQGRPWASHQLGVLLDTPGKIRSYLQVYIDFLDDMAQNGFDPQRGKDPVGVAITREGTIVKVNRGLHRLAMAQRLGLPSIPVQVRHVHRLWWNEVTQGTRGAAALEKLALALRSCTSEENPGPLDEDPPVELPADFWPEPRLPA